MSVCSVEQLDVLLLHVVHTCTCALYWHVEACCTLLQKLRLVKSETSQNASSRINPERSCVKCVFLAWRSQIQLVCFFSCIPPAPHPPAPTHSRQGFQDSASMLSGVGSTAGPDAPQLHTRVSVGQLRSALLQQTASGPQPEKVYGRLHVRAPLPLTPPPPSSLVHLCDDL